MVLQQHGVSGKKIILKLSAGWAFENVLVVSFFSLDLWCNFNKAGGGGGSTIKRNFFIFASFLKPGSGCVACGCVTLANKQMNQQ